MYDMVYTSTYDEETSVTSAASDIINSLRPHLVGTTDYYKTKVIYRWLCQNVEYTSDSSAVSGYDALVLRKANCQGFAVALYRLLREVGVRNYIISGMLEGDQSEHPQDYIDYANGYLQGDGGVPVHCYNLVWIDGAYYYLDASTDQKAGYHDKEYTSFLIGNKNWTSFYNFQISYLDDVWGKVSWDNYEKEEYRIQVQDLKGVPINNAKVTLNGDITYTNAEGIVILEYDETPADLLIEKDEYAPLHEEEYYMDSSRTDRLILYPDRVGIHSVYLKSYDDPPLGKTNISDNEYCLDLGELKAKGITDIELEYKLIREDSEKLITKYELIYKDPESGDSVEVAQSVLSFFSVPIKDLKTSKVGKNGSIEGEYCARIYYKEDGQIKTDEKPMRLLVFDDPWPTFSFSYKKFEFTFPEKTPIVGGKTLTISLENAFKDGNKKVFPIAVEKHRTTGSNESIC